MHVALLLLPLLQSEGRTRTPPLVVRASMWCVDAGSVRMLEVSTEPFVVPDRTA
jgi:hypothetical protein